MKTFCFKIEMAVLAYLCLVAFSQPTYGGRVDSAEAVKVAQWWLATEVGGDWSRIPQVRQGAMLEKLEFPSTRAIWLEGDECLCGALPAGMEALARVIEFPEGGYVLVAADDRIEPVLAFDAEKPFVWEGERGELTRVLVSRMLKSWNKVVTGKVAQRTGKQSRPARWGRLRKLVDGTAVPMADGEEYDGPVPMAFNETLVTASWSQGGFYNDTLQTHVGNDNSVPVGCTATMMGIFMRFFSWPSTASGSNSYWDMCPDEGGVNYWHSVTLGYHSWGSMPLTSLTSANSYVANLLYETGVMTGMNYDQGGSGAWLDTAVMTGNYFYRGIETKTSSHETPIATCIQAGIPVMLSTSSHSMVCDGYRDTTSPYYHINAGHDGGSDGWYSMLTLPAGDTTIDRSYPYCVPNNWRYVQSGWSGSENGDLNTPYNTVGEGATSVTTGGQLWLKAGTYSGTGNIGTYTKAMLINSHGGSAYIQ
jgi:hypothetical protein